MSFTHTKGLYMQVEVTVMLQRSHSNGHLVTGHRSKNTEYKNRIELNLGYRCNFAYFDTPPKHKNE